jgi:calcium-dependent protein kinase
MTARIMHKACSAVNYMHRVKVCHRDLKPENFLFETKNPDSEVKIIDFGLAYKFGEEKGNMHTVVGTPYYVAPEVLRGTYGKECDVWSLGVMMYVLLSGYPPFQGDTQQEVFREILRGNFSLDFEEFKTVSPEAKDMITKMLVLDRTARPSLDEVLAHPWFNIHASADQSLSMRIIASLKKYKAPKKLQQEAMKILLRFLSGDELQELRVPAT